MNSEPQPSPAAADLEARVGVPLSKRLGNTWDSYNSNHPIISTAVNSFAIYGFTEYLANILENMNNNPICDSFGAGISMVAPLASVWYMHQRIEESSSLGQSPSLWDYLKSTSKGTIATVINGIVASDITAKIIDTIPHTTTTKANGDIEKVYEKLNWASTWDNPLEAVRYGLVMGYNHVAEMIGTLPLIGNQMEEYMKHDGPSSVAWATAVSTVAVKGYQSRNQIYKAWNQLHQAWNARKTPTPTHTLG